MMNPHRECTKFGQQVENPPKAQEIGERAKKLVLENYTWEKNVQGYINIYEELLGNDE